MFGSMPAQLKPDLMQISDKSELLGVCFRGKSSLWKPKNLHQAFGLPTKAIRVCDGFEWYCSVPSTPLHKRSFAQRERADRPARHCTVHKGIAK